MMYQLVPFGLLFLVCNAQEHLTCLRTDDVLTPTSSPVPPRVQQGVPGKRGPVGAKGVTGSDGAKGNKGDAGVCDNSRIDRLQGELTTLRQLVEVLNASNNELRRVAIRTVNGWYDLFNGYQYKVTPNGQSWEQSRVICQTWGGDLAVYGIQTMGSRRLLIRGLSLTTRYWIGANDKQNEGTWKWVNGDTVTNEQILWDRRQPDNRGNEDCAEIWVAADYYGRSNDNPCSTLTTKGLCEKPI